MGCPVLHGIEQRCLQPLQRQSVKLFGGACPRGPRGGDVFLAMLSGVALGVVLAVSQPQISAGI